MIIQGIDSSSISRPLLVDGSGRVIISALDLTTTGGKIKVDSAGRVIVDGESPSLYRPVPKTTFYSNLSLPAAGGQFTALTVPANEFWRLTMTVLQYGGAHAPPTLGAALDTGSGAIYVHYVPAATTGIPYVQICDILLKGADVLSVIISAVNLNDDVFLFYGAERVY